MRKLLSEFVLPCGIHVALLAIVYLILSFLGFIHGYPHNENLIQFDVGWYESIIRDGYSFEAGKQSNVGFFPLFPIIWKFLGLSRIGISILNLLFLLGGVYLLYRKYKLDRQTVLLLLSIPSIFFCYVPYSEALFFLGGAIIVYGLDKKVWIAALGVFLACLTRSASMMFIPVILFAKLYNLGKNQNNRLILMETLILIGSAVLSTLLAQYIQYLESGEFFTIFKAMEGWNRVIQLPELYFTTWDRARLVWLDGLALLVGLSAIVISTVFLFRKLRQVSTAKPSSYLFSMGYLSLVSIVTIIYSPVDALEGTSLHSLNRYVFATPFFAVFLIQVLKKDRVNRNTLTLFLALSALTWLSFGASSYLTTLSHFALTTFKTKIYFGVVFIYSLAFVLLSKDSIKPYLWSGLYLFNIILQVYLFNSYILGTWVG